MYISEEKARQVSACPSHTWSNLLHTRKCKQTDSGVKATGLKNFLTCPVCTALCPCGCLQEIEKFGGLSNNEILVYQKIEESGVKGLFQRDLKSRTGITNPNTIRTIIEKLVSCAALPAPAPMLSPDPRSIRTLAL
jgi:hypothetical protein